MMLPSSYHYYGIQPVYRVPVRGPSDYFPKNDEIKRPARTNPTKATKSVPQNDDNKRPVRTNQTKAIKTVKATKNAELWTDVFSKNISEVLTRNLDVYSQDLIRDVPLKVDRFVTADFVCKNGQRGENKVCGRTWDSTQVPVTIQYEIELGRNRGAIHIREYGQRCQRCSRSKTFAAPTIDYDSADRAAKKLNQKILEKFYGEIPPEFPDSSHGRRERKKAHDEANCEGCLEGVCTAMIERRDCGQRRRPEKEVNTVVSHGRKIGEWVLKINDLQEEIKVGNKPKSNRQKAKKGGVDSKPTSTYGKLSVELSVENNQPNQTTSKKSATKPSSSKASTATAKPGSGTVKPGSAIAKLGSGTAKPGTAHTKPGSAIAKSGSTDIKPCTPTSKPGFAATRLKTPTAKPGPATVKPGSAAAKLGSAAAKPGSAAAKPGSAAAKPGSAASKTGSAAIKTGTVAIKTGTVAIKPGSAAIKPGSAATKPGSATTKPDSATIKSPKETTDTSSKSSITDETTIGKQKRGTDKKSEDDAMAEHKIKKRKRNRKRKTPKTEDQKQDKNGGRESKNYTIARDLIMDINDHWLSISTSFNHLLDSHASSK